MQEEMDAIKQIIERKEVFTGVIDTHCATTPDVLSRT
jgi:hypothetical protein